MVVPAWPGLGPKIFCHPGRAGAGPVLGVTIYSTKTFQNILEMYIKFDKNLQFLEKILVKFKEIWRKS